METAATGTEINIANIILIKGIAFTQKTKSCCFLKSSGISFATVHTYSIVNSGCHKFLFDPARTAVPR